MGEEDKFYLNAKKKEKKRIIQGQSLKKMSLLGPNAVDVSEVLKYDAPSLPSSFFVILPFLKSEME